MEDESYRLSCILEGHNSDVRAISNCVVSDENFVDFLLTASRDKTAKLWRRDSASSFLEVKSFIGNTNYISAIVFMPSSDTFPHGLVLTGSLDGQIRAYDINDECASSSINPVFTIEAHSLNVSSLFVGKFDILLSGSWDFTAKMWSERKLVTTLSGHEAAVWCVAINPRNGFMLTGSADKTIKIWRDSGICVSTITGHTDCVRDLVTLTPSTSNEMDELISCSNDATVRHWGIEVSGHNWQCLKIFYGHENYIYGLAALPYQQGFVSCSEDRTMRVWERNGKLLQTIRIPAQSVWCVKVLGSEGDLAAGASDGRVWVFSRNFGRQASKEIQLLYEEELATQKINAESEIGNIKVADLGGHEALLVPGRKDGQTKLVRDEANNVTVHAWSTLDSSWHKVGDVIGTAPKAHDKKLYNGKEYDYVFEIDIDVSSGNLKLPYNLGEDPWVVAQNFIHQHDLPQGYLDQIANFIVTNSDGDRQSDSTSVNNIGTNEKVDNIAGVSCFSNQYFPQTSFLSFAQHPKPTVVLNKLRQFNQEVDEDIRINELNLVAISNVLLMDTVNNASLNESTLIDAVSALINSQKSWPDAKTFPGLDLLRQLVRNQFTNIFKTNARNILDDLLNLIVHNCTNNLRIDDVGLMLSLRTLANLFEVLKEELSKLLLIRESILFSLGKLLADGRKSNVEVAASTVLLNYSVCLTCNGESHEEAKHQCLSLISGVMLSGVFDPEARFRTLVALGTLLATRNNNDNDSTNILQLARGMNMMDEINDWANEGSSSIKTRSCAQYLLQMLR